MTRDTLDEFRKDFAGATEAEMAHAMAREIDRLRSVIRLNGIDPDAEIVCTQCGIRHSRQQTRDPPF